MERRIAWLQKNTSRNIRPDRDAMRCGSHVDLFRACAHGVRDAMVELVATHKKLASLKGLTQRSAAQRLPPKGLKPGRPCALRVCPKVAALPACRGRGRARGITGIEAAFAGAPLDLTAKRDRALAEPWAVSFCQPARCALDAGQVQNHARFRPKVIVGFRMRLRMR